MRFTSRWLRDNAPVTDHVSIVHGDFRTGNFLFDLDTGAITTLLDWEMVRLGDRHEDITYTMSPLMGSIDAKGELLVAGFFPVDEYLDRYRARSTLPIDADRVRYFRLYSFWKQVIITYASSHRAVLERKTHQDILVGASAMVAPPVLQSLLALLKEVL